MISLFLNFTRIAKALLCGSLFVLFNRKLLNKKYVVYLFSSRFGHFLQNTEIFLRNKKNLKDYIFVTESIIDNKELLELWSKYIDIYPMFIGDFLRFFLKKKDIHLRPYIVPQDKKFQESRILKNIFLSPDKKKISKFVNKKYITISFRDSAYNKKFHNTGSRDSYRDTNNSDMKKVINYFSKKNYTFIKINTSFKKFNCPNIFDYGFSKNYNLETALEFIKNADYHIGSNTAIDTYAAFIDKKIILSNVLLGASFPSRLHTSPCLFTPINIFYKKNNKFVPLSKQIEFLKYSEQKFNVSHFSKDSLRFFGIYAQTNSYDEIIDTAEEYQKLVKNSFLLDKNLKDKQKLFWKIYSETWSIIDRNEKIVINSKNFKGNLILSEKYTKKYKGFLS